MRGSKVLSHDGSTSLKGVLHKGCASRVLRLLVKVAVSVFCVQKHQIKLNSFNLQVAKSTPLLPGRLSMPV